MGNEALFLDPNLARFYDIQNPWRQDFTYCTRAAQGARRVLDIGCGTGMLTVHLAKTATVTGLDPAQAMLDIATERTGGDKVRWICGDVREMALAETFDLIVLTGHAFQTLITDADQAAALAAIKMHLAPGGQLIFDSRNPEFRVWESWTQNDVTTFEDPQLGTIEQTSTYAMDGEVLTYVDTYRIVETGASFPSSCRIRFRPKAGLDKALNEAGLAASPCFGDWRGAKVQAANPELVYHVGHI